MQDIETFVTSMNNGKRLQPYQSRLLQRLVSLAPNDRVISAPKRVGSRHIAQAVDEARMQLMMYGRATLQQPK